MVRAVAGDASQGSQFVPQSNDEEELWSIDGILGEKHGKYKVKWSGLDPDTGKPWANTWVPKCDVTQDVVLEWKAKQAAKLKRQAARRSSKGDARKATPSAVSNRTSSTATVRRTRSSVVDSVKSEPSPSYSFKPALSLPSLSAPPRKTNGKRKLSVSSVLSDDSSLPDMLATLERNREASPDKKKRKVDDKKDETGRQKPSIASASKGKTKVLPAREKEEEDSKDESPPNPVPSKSAQKPSTASASKGKTKVLHAREEEDSEDESPPKPVPNKSAKTSKSSSRTKHAEAANDLSSKPKARVTQVAEEEEESSQEALLSSAVFPPAKPGKATSKDLKGKGRAMDLPSKKRSSKHKSAVFVVSEDDGDDMASSSAGPSKNKGDAGKTASKPANGTTSKARHTSEPKKAQTREEAFMERPDMQNILRHIAAIDNLADRFKKAVAGASEPVEEFSSPYSDLTPQTRQRLEEFDASLERIDQELMSHSEVSSVAPTVPYAQSSVDPVAAPLMYPREGNASHESLPDIAVLDGPASSPPAPSLAPPLTPRSSLKGKMKERTPRSKARDRVPTDDGHGNAKPKGKTAASKKPLQPIGEIPLPVLPEHLAQSQVVDSIIEDAVTSFEEPEPTSSIDQFDSPEKGKRVRVVAATAHSTKSNKKTGKERASTEKDSFWTASLGPQSDDESATVKGQKLYEEIKAKEHRATALPKPTLEEVVQRHRASSAASTSSSSRAISPPVSTRELEDDSVPVPRDDMDESFVDEPTQYDEDTQMDLNDDVTAMVPKYVPEEEEESTQDLLQELEVRKTLDQGIRSRSASPVDIRSQSVDPTLGQSQEVPVEDSAADVSMEPQPGTQQNIEIESSQVRDEEVELNQNFVEGTQEIPPTAPTQHPNEESQESNQTHSTNISTDHEKHIVYMTALNGKSEEILALTKQLQDERERAEQLDALVAALREDLRVATASKEQETPDLELQQKYETSTQELADVDAKFTAAQEAWRLEKEALLRQVAAANDKHDTVHQNFLQQYAQNGELHKQKRAVDQELTVARNQAEVGVKAIKEMYERRVLDLQRDRDRWSNTAQFMIRKDALMNDDIRERAGDQPQLKAQVAKLKEDYEVEKMKRALLKVKLKSKTKEIAMLKRQLAATSLDGMSQWQLPSSQGSGNLASQELGGGEDTSEEEGDDDDEGETDADDESDDGHAGDEQMALDRSDEEGVAVAVQNGREEDEDQDSEEAVFVCQWTLDDDASCRSVFPTREALTQHFFDAKHGSTPSTSIGALD